jgi:hypothetical protein
MTEQVQVFLEDCLIKQLFVDKFIDFDFSTIVSDMGLTETSLEEFKILIEAEYGIDMADLITDEDTTTTLAEKIFELM